MCDSIRKEENREPKMPCVRTYLYRDYDTPLDFSLSVCFDSLSYGRDNNRYYKYPSVSGSSRQSAGVGFPAAGSSLPDHCGLDHLRCRAAGLRVEENLFSGAVFVYAAVGCATGTGPDGDWRNEMVFRVAAVWMDGDDRVIWKKQKEEVRLQLL